MGRATHLETPSPLNQPDVGAPRLRTGHYNRGGLASFEVLRPLFKDAQDQAGARSGRGRGHSGFIKSAGLCRVQRRSQIKVLFQTPARYSSPVACHTAFAKPEIATKMSSSLDSSHCEYRSISSHYRLCNSPVNYVSTPLRRNWSTNGVNSLWAL
jgi:hypothetical protein